MSGANRDLVCRYYTALYSPDHEPAIAQHLSRDYVEHQYTAGFSVIGLSDYMAPRIIGPDHAITIHHCLSEGDFVFLFVEERYDANIFARGELFRLDRNGRIAEHWGAQVRDEPNRKNANGTFDGPRVDRRVDYARRHAQRLEALDHAGFNGDLDTFARSRTDAYRQHSPKGGDGLSGLVTILSGLKAADTVMTMVPKRTLADGDFVMSHRFYDTSPSHPLINRINTFDLFRLDEDGRAVEHWDVMEDIPSTDLLDRLF